MSTIRIKYHRHGGGDQFRDFELVGETKTKWVFKRLYSGKWKDSNIFKGSSQIISIDGVPYVAPKDCLIRWRRYGSKGKTTLHAHIYIDDGSMEVSYSAEIDKGVNFNGANDKGKFFWKLWTGDTVIVDWRAEHTLDDAKAACAAKVDQIQNAVPAIGKEFLELLFGT